MQKKKEKKGRELQEKSAEDEYVSELRKNFFELEAQIKQSADEDTIRLKIT